MSAFYTRICYWTIFPYLEHCTFFEESIKQQGNGAILGQWPLDSNLSDPYRNILVTKTNPNTENQGPLDQLFPNYK